MCSVQSIGSICRDKDGDGKSLGLLCNTVSTLACENSCSWDAGWGAITLHSENRAHDFTDGKTKAPDEASWPAWDTRAHQQVHEDWLFEAYQGGMRLMVMSALNNEFLCDLMPRTNRKPGYLCTDADNVTRQFDAAKAMAAASSWYEIAETATEAISIIQQNKLAVILSVEASDIFNTADPLGTLQSLYVDGASTLQALHQFNSKLGGVASHDEMIKIAQTIKNLPSVQHLCKSDGGTGSFAPCDATLDNLNYLGLTNIGKQFIAKMMNLGMPIDISHMSEHSVQDVAEMASAACNYPVYISHGHVRDLIDIDNFRATKRHEKTIPQWQIELVRSTGGMIGLRTGPDHYVFDDYQAAMTADGLVTTVPSRGPVAVKGKFADRGGNQFHFGYAVDYLSRVGEVNLALGSDFNGLIEQMLFEDEHYDRKMSGLAHIGRLPDMFTKLQQTGIDSGSYASLRDESAANYIQMWARAEAFANGQSCCPNPTMSGVFPAVAWAGRPNRVMIGGEGFTPHEALEVTLREEPMSPGIPCSDVEFVSATAVVCTLPILALDTNYDVTVRNDGCGLEATMQNAYFASSTDGGPIPPPIPLDSPFTQADYMTVLADPISANGYATPNAEKIAAVDWTHGAWLGLSEPASYVAGDRPFEDGYSQPDFDASEASPDRGPVPEFLLGLLGIENAHLLTDPITMLEACDMDDVPLAQLAASEGWPPSWPSELETLCSDGELQSVGLLVPAMSAVVLVALVLGMLGTVRFTAARKS